MQPVRKKAVKYKKKWLVLSLVLLFVAAGLVVGFLRGGSKPPVPRPPLRETEAEHVLIDRPEADLTRMDVTNSKGEQFALIKTDAGFQVEGQPGFPLNEMELSLMVKDVTLLVATDLAGEAPEDEAVLAELGLDKTAPRVRAEYADGQQITVVFGADARTEVPSDFIMLEGGSQVYTISRETREHFDRALTTLHTVPNINFNSKLVDEIRVEGQEAFTLKQQEGWWEIISPYRASVDSAAISKLLKSIGDMRLALYSFEGEGGQLEEHGLKPPFRRITFLLSPSTITGFDREGVPLDSQAVPAQQLIIDIGHNYENIGLYCLYDGKVYLGSNASMGFLRDLSLSALRGHTALSIPVNRLKRMTATEGGDTCTFDIRFSEAVLPNNALAYDEEGNQLYDTLVFLGEKELDSKGFLRKYLKLMDIQGAGPLPDPFDPAEEAPIRRYAFELLDGSMRELAFYPYDALHVAMKVNGVFFDFISREKMEALDFLSLMK